MTNVDGQECWAMSYDKYCTAELTNVGYILEHCGLRFAPKCVILLICGYCIDMDVTRDLKADGVQWYQERIGTLRWEE